MASRVLFVNHWYGGNVVEGVDNLVRSMRPALEERGLETLVAAVSDQPNPPEPAEGVHVVPSGGLLSLRSLHQSLGRLATQLDADLIHFFASLSPVLPWRLRWLSSSAKAPVITHITGLRYRHTWGCPRSLSSATTIVGSPFLLQFCPGANLVPPWPPEDLTAEVTPRLAPGTPATLLFLGAFERARGVECLLKATALLRTQTPIRLTIAWNGVGDRTPVDRLIRELGLTDTVTLLGRGSRRDLYESADIVVIPRADNSRMAFPLRIVEAMAAGRPIVVSDACDMGRLVEGIGLAFRRQDPRSLCEALRRLCTDHALYGQLARTARARAGEYSLAAAAGKLIEVYRRVCPGLL
jgi:glycosyltransferase involved in cell wall biosynthesis